MPIFRSNPNAGSFLIEAIEAGVIQKFVVCDGSIGHFKVDDEKHLFLMPAHSRGSGWATPLEEPLLRVLADVRNENASHGQQKLFKSPCLSYFWIVCGDECCELYPEEWKQIIELDDSSTEQTIYVKRPPNCSFRVRGSAGKLPHTVPRERSPSLAVPANPSS